MYVYLLTTGVLYRNGKVTVMRFRKIQGLRQCGENIGFAVRFAGGYPNSFRNTASRKTYAIRFVPLIRIDGLNVNCKGGGIRIITFRITTRLHSKPNRCI
jgi:hypothetical protein